MHKRCRLLALALASAAVLAVLPSAAAADSSRLVVLNGDLTEIVFALGYGDRVVGADVSATYPAGARRLPKIGYQRTLSAEPIIALNPSLILGTDQAGPPATIQQLRSLGREVRILRSARTLSDIAPKIRAVGRALGGAAVARANRLAARVSNQLSAARRLVRSRTRPRVVFLYLRGRQVQQIGGRGSGADAMIAAAGGRDVGAAAGIRQFRPLTPESLVAMRPDYIVTLSAGLQSVGGVSGLLSLPGVRQTPAGRERRVLAFDDQEFLGLGPRTPRALRALIRGLETDRR